MALELVLRSLLNCKKFVNSTPDEKDWLAVSKLVPGTPPKQCAKKWEELCQKSWFVKPAVQSTQASSDFNLDAVVDYLLHRKDSEESSEEMRIDDQDSAPVDKATLSEKIQEQAEHCSKLTKTENTVDQKKDKDSLTGNTKKLKPKPLSPEGPNMVILVCDESKNLKQDFSCPRDLLVNEMKYFAEYLSLEPQRWEEVDISVHCDVQIFDWLMRYVQRDITSSEDIIPKLEPSNVISILISSDFLRMDSLVTKCIYYCHANMSAILSTPCNMNCINDKLVTRISKLFNHAELDTVKDRKDKFKSKLFCKKIEEFVEPQPVSDSCPDNASTLFRCASCKKLLTANNQSKVPCVLSRMKIDSRGQMSYGHTRDVSWDINDHLLNLKEKLKSWRDVYWRLWGATTIMFCHHCHCYFPCTELGHCRYHTLSAKYKEMEQDDDSLLIGIYPCCQKKSLKYDSIGVFTGCHVKDHLLEVQNVRSTASSKRTEDNQNKEDINSTENEVSASPTDSEGGDLDETEQRKPCDVVTNDPSVIKDLLAHRDIICIPYQRLASARASELNVFHDDESVGNWKSPGVVTQRFSGNVTFSERKTTNDSATALPPIRRSKTTISQRMPSSRRKTAILKNNYYHSTEDEEDDEDNEGYRAIKGRIIQQVKKKPSSESRQSSTGFKWDPQRSQRWNQDAQREEDSKRMTEVINAMAKLRSAANQEKKQKSKEYPGGIFHKLDHQFRISTQPPVIKHQTSNSQLATGSRTRRPIVKT